MDQLHLDTVEDLRVAARDDARLSCHPCDERRVLEAKLPDLCPEHACLVVELV